MTSASSYTVGCTMSKSSKKGSSDGNKGVCDMATMTVYNNMEEDHNDSRRSH
jgi:hypothetical protein